MKRLAAIALLLFAQTAVQAQLEVAGWFEEKGGAKATWHDQVDSELADRHTTFGDVFLTAREVITPGGNVWGKSTLSCDVDGSAGAWTCEVYSDSAAWDGGNRGDFSGTATGGSCDKDKNYSSVTVTVWCRTTDGKKHNVMISANGHVSAYTEPSANHVPATSSASASLGELNVNVSARAPNDLMSDTDMASDSITVEVGPAAGEYAIVTVTVSSYAKVHGVSNNAYSRGSIDLSFTDMGAVPAPDADGDMLDDDEEASIGTDPNDPDSDDDGLWDGDEWYFYMTDPLVADTDGGGVDDGEEVYLDFTDPLDPADDGSGGMGGTSDDDSDGLKNDDEATIGTDPSNWDSDGDGLSDGDEWWFYLTNPLSADTDGGGTDDGTALFLDFTDPVDPADDK